MRKKITAISVSILLAGAMVAGCGLENVGDLGNKKLRINQVRYDANGNLIEDKRFADDQMNEKNRINGQRQNSNNLIGSHKNYWIQMNEEIANNITQINEVRSSYVVVTEKNAYVAVSLNENEPKGNAKMMSRTELGRTGKAGIEESGRMRGLSTGSEKLTEELKNNIASVVKEHRPMTEHVYVSADPEFVGRMNAYMNEAVQGRPVQAYIAEFNGMVERLFPAESGDVTHMEVKRVKTRSLLE